MFNNEFLIGCNYWASNAGCHMWREWDENAVRSDMKKFAEAGMNCLRVFPNWADFQPVTPVHRGGGILRRYAKPDGSRYTNKWFIDEEMMRRFEIFCDIAEENGLSLIVGPITGWMSGRLFVPPALYGLNLFEDTTALMMQQKFIEGFVGGLKHKKAIIAWDHGNECDVMYQYSKPDSIISWTMMITNAIRVADPSRPVISGVHNFTYQRNYRNIEHLDGVDIFVTHPYPLWVQHTSKHPILSMKTLVHGAAQAAFYADLAGKPCLVEEIGTMGPMICSEKVAGDFLRINALHSYSLKHVGLLWWNGFDQEFTESPYLENACERELGMFTMKGERKEFTNEMARVSERIKALPEVSGCHYDAVCLISSHDDAWKIAYSAYLLAAQAGITIRFADAERSIPKADAYILPSLSGTNTVHKDHWETLKGYVKNGAKLLMTFNDGIISEFSEVSGLTVEDSAGAFDCTFSLENDIICGRGARRMIYKDEPNGLHCNTYGKGKVYTLDFSPENTLFDCEEPEKSNFYKIYRYVFKEEIAQHPIDVDDSEIGIVWHKEDGLCSIFNYSASEKTVNGKVIPPYDGIILNVEDK